MRFFDVVLREGLPSPETVIQVDSFPANCQIIPVVFIKNAVFEQAEETNADLAGKIFRLSRQIAQTAGKSITEIQFDCDWTLKTADAYFNFLNTYKALSGQELSATIRLHQVKYALKTGIPPVSRGVLMYYNMGLIADPDENSVYDRPTALKYLPALANYPLPLDVALPVFSWGIQFRNGKVVDLLNKMRLSDFSTDTAFVPVAEKRFRAAKSLFRGGYYFKEGDEVKIENITRRQLFEMVTDLKKHSKQAPRELLFYDFDTTNFASYETDIFQKISGSFR